MLLDPIETLRSLVAIASVNPMGREVSGPPFGEARLTEHLEGLLQGLGLIVQRQRVADDRENVVGRLDGQSAVERGGGVILLDAHQDTVPVDGMTIDPFRPEIRQGRLYGRGACDTKGGMAAMLAAVARLADERPPGMPTVLISFTVNEENGFTGAAGLTELWSGSTTGVVPRKPDLALVAEPTELDVVVATKGVVRWRCHTPGRAAHSSRPESGENAIYRMARVLLVLERYARDVVGSVASHPRCGPATLSVGTIHGGISVNTVPHACTIEIDRRLPPGEDPVDARQKVIDYLAAASEIDFPVDHEPPSLQGRGLPDTDNQEAAGRLASVVDDLAGACRTLGVPYGTNASSFAEAGVPAVIFGPGSLEQAHTKDEWVSIEQVRQAAEIYYRFLETWSA